MFSQGLTRRLLIGAVIGAIPGLIVLACGFWAQGIGLIMAGCAIGGVLAIPDVSPRRVSLLFIIVMVEKIIPLGLVKWIYPAKVVVEETPFSDAFTEWILAKDIASSRGWFVVCGLVVGVLFGAGVVLLDLRELQAGRQTAVLPQWGANDEIETQVIFTVTIAIGIAIWITAGCGLFASPAFRRPILLAAAGSSYLETCCGLLAGFHVAELGLILRVMLFPPTLCVGIALLVGAAWEPAKSADQDPRDATEYT